MRTSASKSIEPMRTGPRYKLLAQSLLTRIRSGEFPPGTLLPTENALGEEFNVSRITVRCALGELENRGIVSRRAGIGTRVEAAATASTFIHIGNSIDDVLQFTRELSFRTESIAEITADVRLSRAMKLPRGQRFVRLCGLRRSGEMLPVAYSEHYIPALYADMTAELDGSLGSIAEILAERRAEQVLEVRQELDSARLSEAQARMLQAPRGSACLRSRRWYAGSGGSLIVASTSLFPPGRYVFTSTLRRQPVTA
jgi:DNA-binding GntR family transcriptional regulator